MKGIILAGGKATRFYPATLAVTKQLLPVYDKPMIYYPLSVLMFAQIRDILIIADPKELPRFKELFSDGSQLGLKIQYAPQPSPRGIADALIVGEAFIGEDCVSLVLGDNLFFGNSFPEILMNAKETVGTHGGAKVFGYYVSDPERYGVVTFDNSGAVLSLEEKPEMPRSNYAVTGLYFLDNEAVEIAKNIESSARGELEITSVLQEYLRLGKLNVELLGRGFAWLDTGTPESLLEAGEFIATIEKRQALKIGCIEEIAYHMGYIDKKQLKVLADTLPANSYSAYLRKVLEGK